MPDSPAPHSRSSVVRAGHLADHPTLLAGVAAPDPAVRAAALGGLARSGALTADQLLEAGGDPNPTVRRRAASISGTAVGAQRDPGAALVLRLLADPDPAVCDWACWAAGERPDAADALVGPLVALAGGHDDALVREAAVAALGSLAHPGGRDAVLAACDDVATVRRRAVLALVVFEGPEVDAALARLAGDRDWQVRQAAEELGDVGEPTVWDANGAKPLNPTVE